MSAHCVLTDKFIGQDWEEKWSSPFSGLQHLLVTLFSGQPVQTLGSFYIVSTPKMVSLQNFKRSANLTSCFILWSSSDRRSLINFFRWTVTSVSWLTFRGTDDKNIFFSFWHCVLCCTSFSMILMGILYYSLLLILTSVFLLTSRVSVADARVCVYIHCILECVELWVNAWWTAALMFCFPSSVQICQDK